MAPHAPEVVNFRVDGVNNQELEITAINILLEALDEVAPV